MLNTNSEDICLDDANDNCTETPELDAEIVEEQTTTLTQKTPDDFRAMLPYNTTDPNVHRTQEYLLEMLISHGICTDETFKIFISEKELHITEASKILNELYVVDENATTWTPEDDEIFDSVAIPNENGMQISLNIVDDNATDMIDVPMSPASQISDMTSVLALESPKSRKCDILLTKNSIIRFSCSICS